MIKLLLCVAWLVGYVELSVYLQEEQIIVEPPMWSLYGGFCTVVLVFLAWRE